MKAIVIVLALALTCHAESRKVAWARRAIGITACGLSAWDGAMSAHYLDGGHYSARGGMLVESNGMLANPNGTIRVGRMVGFKVGACLAPFAAEFFPSDYRPFGTIVGGAAAGVYGFTVFHNYRVLGSK